MGAWCARGAAGLTPDRARRPDAWAVQYILLGSMRGYNFESRTVLFLKVTVLRRAGELSANFIMIQVVSLYL
jgi:hypothetical protein